MPSLPPPCQGGKVADLSADDDGVFASSLSLTVTAIMSPELRVVCFYSSSSGGELVADDLVLPVLMALPNTVTTEFQQTEAVPGTYIRREEGTGMSI